MTFQLTEALAVQIVKAMENQEEKFLIDAKNGILVSSAVAVKDEEFFYGLPEWSSEKGFALREEFVQKLHSPLAKTELQNILHSGRGVFKNFKITIKKFPEVEKLWHSYKNKKLYGFIGSWYNNLCEVWGLEKLDEEEWEDNENLLQDDFVFQEFDGSDFIEADSFFNSVVFDCADNCQKQIERTVLHLWKKQFSYAQSEGQTGFVCKSLSGEFAGIITGFSVSEDTKDTTVLSAFYVSEKFRGLGIGTELLNRYQNALKHLNKKWIIVSGIIGFNSFEVLLLNSGFKRLGTGFVTQIQ